MAQLVEQSLPTPGIRGLNPDMGKIKSTNCTIEKTKIKKKRPGMADLKKIDVTNLIICLKLAGWSLCWPKSVSLFELTRLFPGFSLSPPCLFSHSFAETGSSPFCRKIKPERHFEMIVAAAYQIFLAQNFS